MKYRIAACIAGLSILAGCAGGGSVRTLPSASSRTVSENIASPGTPQYAVTNLGTLGGSSSSGNSLNSRTWVTGTSNLGGDTIVRATLWRDGGPPKNLGTLGGPNSAVQWPNHNDSGLIAGIAETATVNSLGEDWSCSAFFLTTTHDVCRGFMWRQDVMTELPTLGGLDGYAAGTNDIGQIVGWAENTTHDPTCSGRSQVLQFKPVMWTPDGRIHELPTLPGDPDGAATAINDRGQIVGISGRCDQAVGRFTAIHSVIWQNGNVADMGNIGGSAWNTPQGINNSGQVVGFANVAGGDQSNLQPHAFLWTRSAGMTDLNVLSGDAYSFANGINDLGQIVGVSYTAGFASSRAFIYENGQMTDLNGSVASGSTLYLISANDINDRGEITGQATLAGSSDAPAFLAVPEIFDQARSVPAVRRTTLAEPALPTRVRSMLRRRFGLP